MLLELRLGNVDLELTNYVYTMQISPIQLEFDHHQAAIGELCSLILIMHVVKQHTKPLL